MGTSDIKKMKKKYLILFLIKMRNLCEYTLKSNRLCKNYKFNDTYCYVHDYIHNFNLSIIILFDLIFYLLLPIFVVFNVFIFINYYIINYLEQIKLYDEIFQLDEILM